MDLFKSILFLTTALALLVIGIGKLCKWPERRGIILGIAVELIGVLIAFLGFFPSDKPATPADVDAIISRKVEGLRQDMVCRFDSLEARLKSPASSEKSDSTYWAQTRVLSECLESIAQTALEKGMVAIGLEKYDEALTHLGYALQAAGENLSRRSTAFYYMGLTYDRRGETALVLKCDDSCVTYSPKSHDAWYNRGNTLIGLGRNEEAIASYDSALVYKPDKDEAWNNRGNALNALGLHEEAIASFDSSLAYRSDDHVAWNNRAVALANLNRFEDAFSSCDSALKYAPGNSEIVDTRRQIMERMNE